MVVFNAPTDVEHDIINYYNCDLAPGCISPLPTMITTRNSCDTLVNDMRKQLLPMCKSLDLRVLNGRYKGDYLGQITFHGNQSSSRVDYIIASHKINSVPFWNFSSSSAIIIFRSLQITQMNKNWLVIIK